MILSGRVGGALDELFADIDSFQRWSRQLDTLILRQDEHALEALAGPEFVGYVEELGRTPPTLLLTPYLCHPIGVSVVSALSGLELAIVHEQLSPGYAAALDRFGVARVSIARGEARQSESLAAISAELRAGRHVGIPLDVPHPRGYPVDCLGHTFRVAYAYAIVAFREGVSLTPIAAWYEAGVLRARRGTSIDRLPGERFRAYLARATRLLYAFLEDVVLMHPEQFRWNEHSVVTTMAGYRDRVVQAYLEQREPLAGHAVGELRVR
jgi:hypothetical protein